MMKTCPYCKFEIPADALVCGHCRKNQPSVSVPKTPEQIQKEKKATRGCLISLGGVLAIFAVIAIVQSVSESRAKREARAEVDRIDKIEQQSSTDTAKAILPGINRYADILEGKIQVSSAERKKEAEELRRLADIANKQSSKVESVALIVAYTTAKTWRRLSDVLRTDVDDMTNLSKIKPTQRAASAEFHRKIAAVLQRHTDEGFQHCSSLEYDLRPVGGLFAGPAPPEPDKYQRYVSEHPEVCADRTPAQCAELPALMKQACDGLGGCTDK